jgi:excisionase family DNA binding protein
MATTEVRDMENSLWKAQQAADYLNIQRSTLYDWVARSVLPCVRLRKGDRRDCIRFRKADLDRVIQQRTVNSREQR